MSLERTAHPYIVREIASIHRLSLAQVYDALSYYYDNEGEIEHYIRNESWGAS